MTGSARRRVTAAFLLILGSGPLLAEPPIHAQTTNAAGSSKTSSPHGRAQRPAGAFAWWKDPAIQKELSLSAVQVKRIDDIYTRFQTEVEPLVMEIATHKRELDDMIAQAQVEPGVVDANARVLTALGAPLNAARITVLYRMSLVLTPAQRSGLATIMARRRSR